MAAGMYVIAVDMSEKALRANPAHETICGDALEQLKRLAAHVDFVWASPPCQSYSRTACWGKTDVTAYPKLIVPVRELLKETGLPYVMENVVGAREDMVNPFMLCGIQFEGLKVFRHRLFETNIQHVQSECQHRHPSHGKHRIRDPKNVRRGIVGDFFSVAGNGGGINWGTLEEWFCAMGYFNTSKGGYDKGAMTQRGLCESIPPHYSKFIGDAVKHAIIVW